MSQSPPTYQSPEMNAAPRKGWFGRNWWWFIPMLVLLPVLCCCGGFGALAWFGVSQMKDTAPYKDSIAAVKTDPAVAQALGSPIEEPGFFEIFQNGGEVNLNNAGSSLHFDARIPLSGPNGTGTLRIDADSPDGGSTWTYTTRELEVDSTGQVINLMSGANAIDPDFDVDAVLESLDPNNTP